MNEFKVSNVSRIVCEKFDESLSCTIFQQGKDPIQLDSLKLVSLPNTKSSYADVESVVSGNPKHAFNIRKEMECITVNWRNTDQKILSCYHAG